MSFCIAEMHRDRILRPESLFPSCCSDFSFAEYVWKYAAGNPYLAVLSTAAWLVELPERETYLHLADGALLTRGSTQPGRGLPVESLLH